MKVNKLFNRNLSRMRIITIDNQKLILISLEKKLSEIGYKVKTARTAEEGIELINSFKPDLVTVDINMPEMSAIDVLKYIKESSVETKVIVMSGKTDDDIILELFEYGIDDYIRKPATLSEVVARVNKQIGMCTISDNFKTENSTSIIKEKCIGVVIPCYNEEDRLLSEEFSNFVRKNLGYHLCFVNDGSTDNTLEILNTLSIGRESHISVFNCTKNRGKAEAVRQGVLYLTNTSDLDLDYIGFLDADLSTSLKDFDDLVETLNTHSYKIISGSRIERIGADITKQSTRQFISIMVNYAIQRILGMKFKDTQCGAKVMHKDVVPILFNDQFITRWLFDVEMFIRLKRHYGDKTKTMIYEQPLKRWIHADGSKLSMKDSLKIGGQLLRIATYYNK